MTHATLACSGLHIHYEVEGRGPDVLFVHGWASSSRMWTRLIAQLAPRFRCWSLDLPGCGDSDKPEAAWYSIPNFTRLLHEFIHLHGLPHARVVGHSMGGMIVLNLAASHPDVVARLVAINPVVTGSANLRPLARSRRTARVLDWAVRLSPRVVEPLLSNRLGRRVNGLEPIRRRTQDFGRASADALFSSGRALVAYDVSPMLARIAAPTLVIVGSRDLQVPTSEGRLAARRIPSARLHEMRGGHLITDDRPGEVAQQLQRFLA